MFGDNIAKAKYTSAKQFTPQQYSQQRVMAPQNTGFIHKNVHSANMYSQ